MKALANTFYNSIKTNALDKGATHVVVLNLPAITKTPRFQFVLDGVALASGGGATGAAARVQAEAVFDGWIQAFNVELASKFAGNSSVALVDFYTSFKEEVANPSQYGLSNVTIPACPITGVGAGGLPTYTFAACTAASLSASPPTGVTDPNWWKTYAFADSFHPSPYAHQLIDQAISKSLVAAGWL